MISPDDLGAELRRIISAAIENEFDIKVSGIKVVPVEESQGDQILEIRLTLTVSRSRWKSDTMYNLINAASRAVRESGEERFPYFQTRVLDKQARVMGFA